MNAAPRYWLAVVALVVLQHWFANAYTYMKPFKLGKGECVDTQYQGHPIGETWYENTMCEKHECIFIVRGNMLMIRAVGCGKITGFPEECRLIPGRGDQYPDCCPNIACQNDADYYDDEEDEDDVGKEDTKVANGNTTC